MERSPIVEVYVPLGPTAARTTWAEPTVNAIGDLIEVNGVEIRYHDDAGKPRPMYRYHFPPPVLAAPGERIDVEWTIVEDGIGWLRVYRTTR